MLGHLARKCSSFKQTRKYTGTRVYSYFFSSLSHIKSLTEYLFQKFEALAHRQPRKYLLTPPTFGQRHRQTHQRLA
ncbi:hypothetical protein SERLA73DRAFT_133738 [Serpula lacrymans var. lacrymans S7.3]|uniref:Uncharacterized protein n=1 Tax=Serpula lacrymans var. lacrymans (strain S7.3) TaxID=936435 RepID=F8PSB2_SERL3|nr:hypothetical protein SERLA73DRAFT_133738 [Serpula lacrymans var. lacrymans S7.3]